MFFLLLGILLLCVCAKIGDIFYYRRQKKEGEGDSAEETVSASAVEVKVEAEPTKLPQKLASLTATTDEVQPEAPGPVIDQPVAINPGRATSYLDLDTNRRVLETSECRPSRRTSDLSEIDDEDEPIQE